MRFSQGADMLSWCDHSSEEVETAVSRTAGPDSEGSQSQLPTVASIATTEVTRSSAMPGAPSAATDPFSARCQRIQMQCESAVKPSETRNEAAPVRSLVSLDSGLTLAQKTCTICMNSFGSRDSCCRLVCGHVFHCRCTGKLLQHTSQTMERDIRICCPNCRKDTVIDRSWTQSAIASQKSRTSQEVATGQPDAVQEQDATGDAKDSGEHGTPTENLASPRCPPLDPQPAASPYSSSVRNKDSKLNLLIDFGAQDSLVGAVWLHKLLKKLKGKSVLHVIDPRPRSLKVGRVGNPGKDHYIGQKMSVCHWACRRCLLSNSPS